MLGEITHLQAIIDDLTVLTTDPHKLPPASEQVKSIRRHDIQNTQRQKQIEDKPLTPTRSLRWLKI